MKGLSKIDIEKGGVKQEQRKGNWKKMEEGKFIKTSQEWKNSRDKKDGEMIEKIREPRRSESKRIGKEDQHKCQYYGSNNKIKSTCFKTSDQKSIWFYTLIG